MSHYAEIDENDIVIRVIVADADFINSGAVGDPSNWIKTSYNSFANNHYKPGSAKNPENIDNTKPPLRKNFAAKGFKYDRTLDAFIPPKPFNSWVLNEESGLYESPIPEPEYDRDSELPIWDEVNQSWVVHKRPLQ